MEVLNSFVKSPQPIGGSDYITVDLLSSKVRQRKIEIQEIASLLP